MPCEDDWVNVYCNQSRVTRVDLSFSSLSGSISSSFGLLDELENLNLDGNNFFYTPLPSEIGELTNLQIFSASLNFLSGSIPTSFGKLSSLIELNLYYNFLTKAIPTELGELTSLVELNIGMNYLTGNIPTELGLLNNLTGLLISSNGLVGTLPSQLSSLTSLVQLQMLGLYLSGSLPSQLSSLHQNLQYLNFNSNDFTGTFPWKTLTSLTALTYLDAGGNQFQPSHVPTKIGLMTNLSSLGLSASSLMGEIPWSSLSQIPNLNSLYLSNNNLNGTISGQIIQASNSWQNSMRNLGLNENLLTGTIPSEIGLMVQLRNLWLGNNYLSGLIPSSLLSNPIQFNAITSLTIQSNLLTGYIPPNLEKYCTLSNANVNMLQFLFDCNFFTGPAPSICMSNITTPCTQCLQSIKVKGSSTTLTSSKPLLGNTSKSYLNGQCMYSSSCFITPDTTSTIYSSSCSLVTKNQSSCTPVCAAASGYHLNTDGNLAIICNNGIWNQLQPSIFCTADASEQHTPKQHKKHSQSHNKSGVIAGATIGTIIPLAFLLSFLSYRYYVNNHKVIERTNFEMQSSIAQ